MRVLLGIVAVLAAVAAGVAIWMVLGVRDDVDLLEARVAALEDRSSPVVVATTAPPEAAVTTAVAAPSECDEVVDAGIDLLQGVLDEVAELSLAEVIALGDEPPAALGELEARGRDLEARAGEIGCSDEELQAGLTGRLHELDARGPLAELILDGLRSEGLIFGN